MGVTHKTSQFLSNVFVVPTPDNSYRLVLNLKSLNKFVRVDHFKMENHETVRGILQKFFFMAKLDLKEAYFMLSVNKSERKFLRFVFQDQI